MTAPATGRRVLGLPALLALGVNGVVGVGIFFAPTAVAAAVPGDRGLLVYASVAVACAPVALVFARLGRAFDEDGGPYLYARAAFGERVGFAVGWVAYVSSVLSASSVLLGLVTAVDQSWLGGSPAPVRGAAAVLLTTALALVLGAGLRVSATLWNVVTIAKLVPLLALLGASALAAAGGSVAPARAAMVAGTGAWLASALTVLFTLQGFEIVPVPAGHVDGARRAVPIATLGALAIAAVLYVALHAVAVAYVPDLAHAELPLAAAARAASGPRLEALVSAGTSVSALGIAIGMIAMTPRYLAALGAKGALGARLGEESPRGVPLRAMAITWALVSLVVAAAALWGSLAELFALASIAVLLQYGVTAASLFRLARRRERGLVPRDAWPAPLVLVVCALLLAGAGLRDFAFVAVALALGVVVRAVAARRSTH